MSDSISDVTVELVISVNIRSRWGVDTTVKQVNSQATEEAMRVINNTSVGVKVISSGAVNVCTVGTK